jgi:methylenetetrahydrofolate--tRNA-(uracil-5-)-methyltransferase
LNKEEYEAFIDALLAGDKTSFKEWENTPYFEGCLPIEVMAERGRETLRFGPMKPVGLVDPRTGKRPWAVVQLRQDNALGTLFNMVGFQTKLKHGAQSDVIRMIPGLEQAQFARLGGIHRNTFLNSPKLLDSSLRLKARPDIRFAGQITGCEGYVESAAIGLLAGRFARAERLGGTPNIPPITTALGALLNHVTGGHVDGGKGSFQPMNVNFGLFPELSEDAGGKGKERGRLRKKALAVRALADLETWLDPAEKEQAEDRSWLPIEQRHGDIFVHDLRHWLIGKEGLYCGPHNSRMTHEKAANQPIIARIFPERLRSVRRRIQKFQD